MSPRGPAWRTVVKAERKPQYRPSPYSHIVWCMERQDHVRSRQVCADCCGDDRIQPVNLRPLWEKMIESDCICSCRPDRPSFTQVIRTQMLLVQQRKFGSRWLHKLPSHSLVGTQYHPGLLQQGSTPKVGKATIIQCYAPTNEANDKVKSGFYASLQGVIDEVARKDLILLLGNFNAKVGSSNTLQVFRQLL